MKRLLSICLLILCLSFPALAGHTTQGGFWCNCDDQTHGSWGMVVGDEIDIQQNETPGSEESELDLLIDALLILLKF